MASDRQRQLVNLLNQSRAANIPHMRELDELINEYFINDATDMSDDEVSSEEEEEEELENLFEVAHQSTDETHVESDTTDSESEEHDSPLVRLQNNVEGEDNDTASAANADYPTVAKAEAFKCKCTQIKTASEDHVEAKNKRGCISQFTPEEILSLQLGTMEMTWDELDIFIMGVFSATMHQGPTTANTRRKNQKERERTRTSYTMLSRLVCKQTFMFLTGIKDKRLRNVMKHYKEKGPCPRENKRGGRKNNIKALSLEEVNRVCSFIKNYAETHAVSLPGRVASFKRDDILLLPSSTPKRKVHQDFLESCAAGGFRPVAISTFRKLWAALLQHIVTARPMTDLCWICKNNMHRIHRRAKASDEEKTELLMAQHAHLQRVEEGRKLYRAMTADCKAVLEAHGIEDLARNSPCSRDFTCHYSFDFAQQVHLPHSPFQPGPMYFLTPRKVGIFGVCCEGLPEQINYLIDEGPSSSKGSNVVVSYLHPFFENYGVGEKHCHLHCDNCSGQNKNRFMLWYCAWRVMTGKHQSITLNFMPPGHTKFAPDWCFGLLKRTFRRSEVHCLDDLCKVVEDSTPVKKVNRAQIVRREASDARPEVIHYDWQNFFRHHFRTLLGIKKIAHFSFAADKPGIVVHRQTLTDPEREFQLVGNVQTVLGELDELPSVIPPPGLSQERQAYLFKTIRDSVRDGAKDILTPDPDAAQRSKM